MSFFMIKDNRVIVDERILTVPAFNNIWEHFEDKNIASKFLMFIFAMNDITQDNPYLEVPYYEKEPVIKLSLFGNKDYAFTKEEEILVREGQKWFNKLNEDSPWRSLCTLNQKIDQLNKHLAGKKMTEKNYDSQSKTLLNIEKLLKSRENIQKMVYREVEKARAKGDMQRSPIELGLITYRGTKKT